MAVFRTKTGYYIHVTGFDKVRRRMQYAFDRMGYNSLQGMVDVARKVHISAKTVSPTIPRDTGNLASSRFIVTSRGTVPWGLGAKFTNRGMNRIYKDRAQETRVDHQQAIAKYRNRAKISKGKMVIFGYSARYAPIVHELGVTVRSGETINWTVPGSGPKFFQAAINREANKMLATIGRKAHTKNIGL